MKRTLAAIAALMISATGYSQGTFIFNNRDTGDGIDAKVVDTTGAGVSAGFTAQVFLVNGTSVTPLLPSTTFRTGAAAGYVNAPTDPITVPGVAGGSTATLRMVAFNGSAYNDPSSTVQGASKDFTITLGGGGSPPSTPAPMVGLTGFTVVGVPEPATIALGVLGLGALLIRRKK